MSSWYWAWNYWGLISQVVQPIWNKWWYILPAAWYWSWGTLLLSIKCAYQSEMQLLLWIFIFKCYSKPICEHYRLQNVFIVPHYHQRSKANFRSFEICLETSSLIFSEIGLSETCLNDYHCGLYSLDGYNCVEAHRSGRSGGGVGIFLMKHIL